MCAPGYKGTDCDGMYISRGEGAPYMVELLNPASFQALHADSYKQIIQIGGNRIKNLNWQEATSRLFTIVAKDLNSGRPRTNPGSG